MEYERIHKVPMGVISPTKLRMKLMGARKKDEGGSNSSRASPSKQEDLKNVKNSLLSDLDVEDSVVEVSPSSESSVEKLDTNRNRNQNMKVVNVSHQAQPSGNLSTVHPVRSQEEEVNGYDSGHDNGSTASFEFHKGERTLQNLAIGPFFRHVPSKWNDAEKWIVNRQAMNQNVMKKVSRNQGARQIIPNWMRIPQESAIAEQKHFANSAGDTKMVDFSGLSPQNVVEKFSFDPRCFEANTFPSNGTNVIPTIEECASEVPTAEAPAIPAIESVSMRDVGTEMTPIPSQDPSRTGTPIGATTPSRSPMSSMPSTPKRGAPTPSPADGETECQDKTYKLELSDRELQIKTRREIAALGVRLGKVNIASWATQAEAEPATPSLKTPEADQIVKSDYLARAAAWEEAEKSKHIARYKREEIKIQAWESQQRAKFEANMRETEAQVERVIAVAQDKMLEKIALARQRVEAKRAAAEGRRNRRAARTAQQVEKIRQTGYVPSHFRCCSWFL